jgi:prepilin peptidase CpaA
VLFAVTVRSESFSDGKCELIAKTSLGLLVLPIACSGAVLMASLHDIATRTIPNGLAMALATVGIAIGVLNGNLLGSFLAAFSVFFLSALCWRYGWIGGGDVKLLGAATLAVPPGSVLTFVAAMAISGGLLAILYLAVRPFVRAPTSVCVHGLIARVVRIERWRISRGRSLPYACAIAAGYLFATV